MPVTIKKRKKRKCYRVSTPKGIKAKCTTKRKAEAQRRLLMAVELNPDFRQSNIS